MVKKNNKLILIGIGIIALIVFMNWESPREDTNTCNPVWNPDSRYDSVTFCTSEEAIAKAAEVGCDGFHTHIQDGETIFMSCENHEDLDINVMSTY